MQQIPMDSFVVIDKSEHQLTYFTYNIPVRSFKVAVGTVDEATPSGLYEVLMMVKSPWYLKSNIPGGDPKNPLGSRWIGLSVPGTNGSKYGIHGTNRPDSIGKSESAGCVRMYNSDVQWLYQHIRLGTWVQVNE